MLNTVDYLKQHQSVKACILRKLVYKSWLFNPCASLWSSLCLC